MIDIAIFGSATNFPDRARDSAVRLGASLADAGCRVLTGACPGLPYYAAQAAYQRQGYVIGYSPARTRKEHTEYFGDPDDVFSELVRAGEYPITYPCRW